MFGTAQKRRQQQELQELTGMVAALKRSQAVRSSGARNTLGRIPMTFPRLLATTALISAGLAASAQAQVQDNPTAEVDEIVVTGQREAQRAAIAVKRAEFEVMDAVSADDIGKLPDHNTAAALRRIPGVSIMEDQGEPRFPTIRGLRSTYNRTTVDGAIVGSVDESGWTYVAPHAASFGADQDYLAAEKHEQLRTIESRRAQVREMAKTPPEEPV